MKKERIMAIIGIVLPIIGFCAMMTTYDSVSKMFVPTVHPVGAEYTGAIKNQIWVQELIVICVLLLYQVFYYVVSLIKGVKDKIKSFVIFSIIGLILGIGLLISGIGGAWARFSLTHILYSIIFSIVMLVRSFKKLKN